MTVEIKGQQLRIRVANPKNFVKFRTQDVGTRGKMLRVAGMTRSGTWRTQSWRFNLDDYSPDGYAFVKDLGSLNVKGHITKSQYVRAQQLFKSYYR
jgi:hypothetical protein